jgi:hypothetical protein
MIMKTTFLFSVAAAAAGIVDPSFAQISVQSAPPVVVRTTPIAGDTNVSALVTEIRVTYSKSMQDGSWSWSTWGEETFPEVTGKIRYLEDGCTCVLPVKLEPGKFYATWLNSDNFHNFKDASGQAAVPYLLTFCTAPAGGQKAIISTAELDSKIGQLSRAGMPVEEAIRLLGEPQQYRWGNAIFTKDNLPDPYILQYPGGVRLVVTGGCIAELRSESPGPGFSYRGTLRLGSTVDEVLATVGPPTETVVGKPLAFEPGVLYRDIDGKKGSCYYARPEHQIRCFFSNDKVTALYLPLGESTRPAQEKANSGMLERDVNKLASEFSEQVDLSTPESACAAWQRASATKDSQMLTRLSMVVLDPAEQDAWYERQQKRDPDGLEIYLKALAESKIVTVQIWRGELANVVTYLPFPEGKGRHPFSSRTFGLVNGEWKNIGEDRLPALEAAKANFEKKKENLWRHFLELKQGS